MSLGLTAACSTLVWHEPLAVATVSWTRATQEEEKKRSALSMVREEMRGMSE